MSDQRAWFSEVTRRRITVTEIAEHLGVSRKTAQNRLAEGLSADDLIALARALHVSPIDALVELDKLEYSEVYGFLEGEGKLVETATEGELALELATRLNPTLQWRTPGRTGGTVHQLKPQSAPTLEDLEGEEYVAMTRGDDEYDDDSTDHDYTP
ncbi:helix-turn-helix domain-containing protein [Rhodococcus pyridinivorans]|uniref:HTH cro/C1-type domain-containing protein n=1 Tax=Rhodococcus pyridinivorans AK37 TaxID=1114960 RepID=H0JL82_9NOCA|nr:helix-turn-helix transcriptional regulator [Rhodococcus pyridinivorans]EHK86417.1 hypothetical protein AK37_01677 [Rhodococcus pyridinivorans AK37]MCD2139491.1 helix-turn-helix transcriptional regulator [Rhodococcus pyridinivorans]